MPNHRTRPGRLIATLIANPAGPSLDATLASNAAIALGGPSPDWLGDHACDIALPDTTDRAAATSALRLAIGGRPVDCAIQEATGRRKAALIADMDSTMIGQECIDELAAEAGFGDRVAAITARAMNGEIAFEPALRERVALLKGLPVATIEKVLAERIRIAPGARALVATMRAAGAYAALVSGGFTSFTAPVAKMLGFDENRANVLGEMAGLLTGKVAEPVLGRDAKVAALRDICASRNLAPADVIAVGDGANDLGMLALAGAGVALHAKPSVAAQAAIRIDHGDLTALLYLQGYRRTEFRQ
jgi:phosphoserine phosphatase